MNSEVKEPAKRRRGRALEDALLDAAWEQLVTGGYGTFTIDAVAERAATSKTVIYRRWASREALAIAAVKRSFDRGTRPIPDTGTLRGDVIAMLTQANETRFATAAVISVQLAAFFQETGETPASMREELLGDRATSMTGIMQRAVERGEVKADRLTPRMVALPFDLARHEVLMTLKPVPREAILEIVDDIFLPLVGATATAGR